jgi:3-phosphoshikimate 1-carboxyvinyltransferase
MLTAPRQIDTDILLPASKSICNRVLIINALAGGKQTLSNLSDCDDTRVMINALRDMPFTINIGAAGTAMRFLTAYLSTHPSEHIITGTERMQHRPIEILVEALRSLGARISYEKEEGFPPLHIDGTTLQGGRVTMRGNVSSQYISALLLIAPTLKQGLTLHLTDDIISRSYINMTLSLMKDFGAEAHWEDNGIIVVEPSGYNDIPYTVESDWSASSYWYEIAALCSNASIRLSQLHRTSYQGDSRVVSIFEKLGVHTQYTNNGVALSKTNNRTDYFEDDFSDIPDLAQTVVVTCALLQIPFRITGLQTLKIKETDRIEALKSELKKLGYILKDEEDSILTWEGALCTPQPMPSIHTYEDHRMAMAFAPAALKFNNIQIEHPEVVNKSYVGFWDNFKKAGFDTGV